jgi:hypothetical protein
LPTHKAREKKRAFSLPVSFSPVADLCFLSLTQNPGKKQRLPMAGLRRGWALLADISFRAQSPFALYFKAKDLRAN